MYGAALTLLGCGRGFFTPDGEPSDSIDTQEPPPTTDTTTVRPDIPGWLAGVNLSAADFNPYALPGTYGTDYTWPTEAELDYFASKRMNVVRVPFRWERLQPGPMGEFDAAEVARMDAFIDDATGHELTVILDVHNYARYWGGLVIEGRPIEEYTDLWRRLAERYRDEPLVIFGLMNEPHDLATENWLAAANAAIAAIRAAGAHNLLLVPGNAWTGAWSWHDTWYGTPNATLLTGVVDPDDNFAIEVHQYLDWDSFGTSADCVSGTIGSERIAAFTEWARSHGVRAFLGETGAASNPICDAAVDDLLTRLELDNDVWMGWTWWAAGPWWWEYPYSIEPRKDGSDAPQMAILSRHL